LSKYFRAEIISNTYIGRQFRLLSLAPLSEVLVPLPGQFYMLQAGDTSDPLLKRPFSIFDYSNDALSFLYRIRGKGTFSLSKLKEGDIIQAIGPLGNSYPFLDGDFIAIAGGIGIASLYPILKKFKNRAYLFYGARNKDELVMTDEARALSKKIFFATEDGSKGQKGLVTDLLRGFLKSESETLSSKTIYACGPLPMLRELSRTVDDFNLKCFVSLEEHMACGVGACLGCVVKVREHNADENIWTYNRVCKEGPVFDIRDIVWIDGVTE